MTIILKIQNRIDQELVNKAEQELYQILLQQRFAFNDRFNNNKTAKNVIKFLRMFGLSLSILVVVVFMGLYTFKSDWSSICLNNVFYIMLFMAFALVFYYLPLLEKRVKKFTKNSSERSCKKIAARCVKKARKLAPFNAEYDIKGDLITYYRSSGEGDDAVWQLAWFRRFKGVAIHGDSATAIFKKWTSIQPSIILLHEGFTSFENVFNALNIEHINVE